MRSVAICHTHPTSYLARQAVLVWLYRSTALGRTLPNMAPDELLDVGKGRVERNTCFGTCGDI